MLASGGVTDSIEARAHPTSPGHIRPTTGVQVEDYADKRSSS